MSETHDTRSFRIEYRHLAFFFVGAVCVCAVFFALGFVVGRAQAFEMAARDSEDPKAASNSVPGAPSISDGAASAGGKDTLSAQSSLPGKADSDNPGAADADYRNDLDFYKAVKEPKVDQNFHPEPPKPPKAVAAGKPATDPEGNGALGQAKRTSSRSAPVSLQVAALKSSAEAHRLAKTLRSKGYPVFVVTPAKEDASKLVRVQIGPYTSDAEAAKVKARLSAEGYKAISKH